MPRRVVPAIRAWNIILLLVLAALGVATYFALRTTPKTAAATVRSAPVARGVVLSSVSASGSIAVPKDLSVGFETSGQVVDVAVKPGEHVSKGQVLGRLDQTDARASVSQAAASLASAKANLLQAETGETAVQRAADAASLAQTQAQIKQAQTSLGDAKAQLKADERSTATSIAGAKSTLSLQQAKSQLRTDQGALRAAVAKLKADNAKLTINGTTYATVDQAVSAWTNIVNQDKASQQAQTQANYDLQTQQTLDEQQLSADQNSLKSAAPSDQSAWQAKVDSDQDTVNYDGLRLQQQQKLLNQIQYQLSQDQSSLQTVQTLQSTLTQDQSSITSSEAKIVSDRNQIATATSQRLSQIQTAEATRTTTLAKDEQSITSAKQQVTSAKLSLTTAKANNATKSYVAPATLAQDRAQVLQAASTLATARKTLAQTVLRAPVSGTVSKVGGVVGETVSGSGITANSSSSSTSSSTASSSGSSGSSAFVELVDLEGMQMTASFSESDAAKIRLGQAATVTVSALPNQELAAHVVAIDTSGTSSSGVVEYTVTLVLDRTTAGLKPGMSANATVTTSERDNVLNVPSAAVTGTGQNARVTVVRNGKQQSVSVVAGLKGDSTTEVVSGLKAGQQVVTSTGTGTGATGTGTGSTGFPSGRGLGGGLGGGGGFPGGGFPGG